MTDGFLYCTKSSEPHGPACCAMVPSYIALAHKSLHEPASSEPMVTTMPREQIPTLLRRHTSAQVSPSTLRKFWHGGGPGERVVVVVVDSGGCAQMTRELFLDAVFEMCDCWTLGCAAAGCLGQACRLSHRAGVSAYTFERVAHGHVQHSSDNSTT